MPIRCHCTLLLAVLTATAGFANAQIKRWVDERGVVHYSDEAPSPGARVASPVTEVAPAAPLSAAEQQAAERRLRGYRDALNTPAAPARDAPPPGPNPRPASEDNSCAAQWARYNAAYACMDPYRLSHGGLRPEAFKRCPVLTQPSCEPPARSAGKP
jgi:hypothetical protein